MDSVGNNSSGGPASRNRLARLGISLAQAGERGGFLSGARRGNRLTAELEALYDLSRRLRTALTPEEMFPIIVQRAMRLLQADYGALSLLNPDRQMLTRVYTLGVPVDELGSTFPISSSICGQVIQTGVPYLADDFGSNPMPDQLPALREATRVLGPIAAVAVQSEREIIGVIVMGRRRREDVVPFIETDVRLLQGIAEMGGTALRRAGLNHNLEQAYIQMVLALARAMDARDTYTADHSERLAAWAEAVALALGCTRDEVQDIRWGALLHDIGKIGAPDGILRKPGPLTKDEWVTMRQHPVIGERILRSIQRMQGVAKIVRHHQEKWDGTGYPDGLRRDAIPLGARILAVVDAYGVIIDERPYKSARTHEEAMAELKRCAGTQFDPKAVEAFCRVLEREKKTGLTGPSGFSAPRSPRSP